MLLFNAKFNLGKTASQVLMVAITIQRVDLDILLMQRTQVLLGLILVYIHIFIV